MKKKLFLLLFLLVLFLSGLWFLQNNFFGDKTSIVVGPKWINQAQFAGMFVAQERGIYSRRGLDVSFKEFDFETDLMDDLLSEKTDFAVVGAEEFLLAVSEGAPITAVAAIYQVSPYSIVSLASSGIKTPADFRNKVLGNKAGKIEEVLFYQLLLSSVGLSEQSVTMQNVGFEYMEYQDLMSGDVDTIDLYRTDQLYFFEKENIDYNIIHPEQFGINTFNDIIITRNSLIKNNPELVNNFVISTIEGWEYALENKKDAAEDTLKYVADERYFDSEYQQYILENSAPLIKPNTNTEIGSMSLSQWEKLYEQMSENGFVKKGLDVSEVFSTEFIH